MIINDSSENSEIIDSVYKVYTVHNVKECFCDVSAWNIEVNNSSDITNQNVFFICEITPTAVSHWVYESAIYLELFKLLKEKYHTIKLLIIGKRTFKTLYFNLFDIPDTDVIYQDITPHENKYVIPNEFASNICIFPSPIANLLRNTVDSLYQKQLLRFCHFFKKIDIQNKYSIDTLILPRQKKENFVANDRTIDFSHIFDFFDNNRLNHDILHTDTITDLKQQIDKVRSSKHIILCDGAAFSLNLLFCSNKSFFVITRSSELQQVYYPMAGLLIDTLCSFNNNKYIYFNDQDDFLSKLPLQNTPKN
jgi:hypothetical protein